MKAGGRARANGLVNGAALVGIAATPSVFGFLITGFQWPAAFLIASVLTAAVALVWTLLAAETPGPARDDRDSSGARDATADLPAPVDEPGMPAPWLSLLRDRSLMLLTLSYAAVGYFQYLFFYWMEYYFERVLHLPESRSRVFVAIPALAMGAGMVLGGWLSDKLERIHGARWGRRIVPIGGMAAGAALLWLGVRMQDEVWIVALFAMAMAGVGAAEGPHWATAVELGGRRGGSAAGILNTGGNVGGVLAPIITPWAGEHYGWAAAVMLGSLVSLSSVVMWLGIDAGRKPPVPKALAEAFESGMGPGPL
jgi:MFS family permease